MEQLKEKRILLIGGTGSLGHYLVNRLSSTNELFILSRDETKQWMMQNRFYGQSISYYLCDIRDFSALQRAIRSIKPEVIINASALKQVPSCEQFPNESIATNIQGVQNLIHICTMDWAPETVVGISTDKACKPVNVYGMCKAVGERLYTSVSSHLPTRFICVRYGNVLESRGSIVPLFKYHARTDRQYPITSVAMTRFFLTLDESVDLILTAIAIGKKGDTFVPAARSAKIIDLAEIFVERFGGSIIQLGIRPGEKTHEELINEEELRRTYLYDGRYFVIKPFLTNIGLDYDLKYSSRGSSDTSLAKAELARCTSDMFLFSKEELIAYLERHNVLGQDSTLFSETEVKF